MKSFGMFTENGSYMVGRIATADEFGEATDTAVREEVYDVVIRAAGERCDFYL